MAAILVPKSLKPSATKGVEKLKERLKLISFFI
jgi:hypothetical protein